MAFTQKETTHKKNSLLQKRGSVAELSDQQSGLFSKCWRVLTEFSKLPFGREVSVHRKLKFPSWSVRLRINQSPERDVQGFLKKGLIINNHKISVEAEY